MRASGTPNKRSMKFSSPSDKAGLIEDIDFLCGTNSTSYPTADKVRNINRWYYKAVIDILKAAGRVQFDDTNQTTLPIVTFNLVDGQSDYSNPADLLKLHAIEVKDKSGNSIRLKETDISDLKRTITDFDNTPGIPEYYDQSEGSFVMYPAPSSSEMTLTDGGKLYLSREVDVFTADDTTQEPGFAEPFHRILSLGASYDWFLIPDPQKASNLKVEIEQLRAELREFYGDKNQDVKTAIHPAHKVQDYL